MKWLKKQGPIFATAIALVVLVTVAVLVVRRARPPAWRQLSAAEWKRPLEQTTTGADRIEVAPARHEGLPAVFELKGAKEVRELIALIEIDPSKTKGVCMCWGDVVFRFYRGDKLLATLAFAHGTSLKWRGWPQPADAVLTENCQVALPQWFKEKGYAALEEARLAQLAEEDQEEQEATLFASFFPQEVRGLVLGRSNTTGDTDSDAGARIARLMGDPKAVVVAASRALGVTECGMSMTADKERRALAAAATASDEAFLAALQELSDDKRGLCGAARLFFWEHKGETFAADTRTEWAARLGEAVFTDGLDEDKSTVLRRLSSSDDPRVRALMHKVVAGEVGTEINPAKAHDQEPGLRCGAALALATLGDETVKAQIVPMLSKAASEPDRAALEVSLALLGDPSYIRKEHFALRSYSIGLAAVMAIERFNGTEGMDALVEGGIEHPWAGVSAEAVAALQRITKQDFQSKALGTFPRDNARAWWRAHRDEWLRKHPASRQP